MHSTHNVTAEQASNAAALVHPTHVPDWEGFSWFETADERAQALEDLKALSPAARKLLAEVVEATSVTRKSLSNAATALEGAGFISIRDNAMYGFEEYTLQARLVGEEALALYEHHAEAAASHKAAKSCKSARPAS